MIHFPMCLFLFFFLKRHKFSLKFFGFIATSQKSFFNFLKFILKNFLLIFKINLFYLEDVLKFKNLF